MYNVYSLSLSLPPALPPSLPKFRVWWDEEKKALYEEQTAPEGAKFNFLYIRTVEIVNGEDIM